MRASLLLLAVASLGCALVEDFDSYSENRSVDSSVADGFTSTDTIEPIDSAPPDTERPDTAPPPDDTGACLSGWQLCGGSCFDIANDREHCGGCTSCDAQGFKGASRCVAGKCECAAGATKCTETCTYLDSDPLNCKACGAVVTDSSQVCSGGNLACAPGLKLCDPWDFTYNMTKYDVTCTRTCVDTAHDGNHCYKYGTSGAITNWQRCYNSTAGWIGVCVGTDCKYRSSTGASPCTGTGRIECGVGGSIPDPDVRSCVDRFHDPNHCGGCDKACARGELCAAGVCKAYRPAKSPSDCTGSFKYCTPPGFAGAACIDAVATCPT